MSEEAHRVFDAMEALGRIADPVERAKALTEVLKGLPAHNKRLKEARQATFQELLARPGATLRSVGIEVGINHGSVQDIVKGYSGSGTKRPKATATPPDEESRNG